MDGLRKCRRQLGRAELSFELHLNCPVWRLTSQRPGQRDTSTHLLPNNRKKEKKSGNRLVFDCCHPTRATATPRSSRRENSQLIARLTLGNSAIKDNMPDASGTQKINEEHQSAKPSIVGVKKDDQAPLAA